MEAGRKTNKVEKLFGRVADAHSLVAVVKPRRFILP